MVHNTFIVPVAIPPVKKWILVYIYSLVWILNHDQTSGYLYTKYFYFFLTHLNAL